MAVVAVILLPNYLIISGNGGGMFQVMLSSSVLCGAGIDGELFSFIS